MEENGIILFVSFKKRGEQMKSLYSKVEISKVLDDFKETRKYYVTKDNTYGFAITKTENDNLVEKEILSMNNLVDSEDIIKSLIDELIKCGDDLTQAQYIVEDYIKSQTTTNAL